MRTRVIGASLAAVVVIIGAVRYVASDRHAGTQAGVQETEQASPHVADVHRVDQNSVPDSNSSLFGGMAIADDDINGVYDNNQVRADQLFTGHNLVAVGIVSDISRTDDRRLFCLLDSQHVVYVFDDGDTTSEDAVAKFNRGDKVFLRGECTGLVDRGTKMIRFVHCKVDKQTDDERARVDGRTKDEFIAKLEKLETAYPGPLQIIGPPTPMELKQRDEENAKRTTRPLLRSDLIEAFGEPYKEWTHGYKYIKWRCSDGSVTLILYNNANPDGKVEIYTYKTN